MGQICYAAASAASVQARHRVARIAPTGELLRRLRLLPGIERADLKHARVSSAPVRTED